MALCCAMNPQPNVAALAERVDWLQRVGWRLVVIYAVIFCSFVGGLVRWYLPRELDRARSDFRRDIDAVNNLELDKLSAQLSASKKSGNVLDPQDVQKLGADVFVFVNSSNAGVSQRAWRTVNDIVGYYSFAHPVDASFVERLEKYGSTIRGKTINDSCVVSQSTAILYQGIIFEDCTLHLNDLAERNIRVNTVLFRHVRVIYEKGQVSFNRVAFEDCTFEIALNPVGRRMGQTLLAKNDITNFNFP